MPRFFFHKIDSRNERDREGVDLPDEKIARSEAVMLAGALLGDDPSEVCAGGNVRIEVTNEAGSVVFSILATGETPAAG